MVKNNAPKKEPVIRKTIMDEAKCLIYGDRAKAYGSATANFTDTANMWSVILRPILKEGEKVTPKQIALCMVAVKLCREVHAPKIDNLVDSVGYLGTIEKLYNGE